jgi:hypothetical protein
MLNDDGSVTFSSSSGQSKTYRIVEGGVQFEVDVLPLALRSGLALDSWRRIESGWGNVYRAQITPDSLVWHLVRGPSVSIRVSGGSLFAFIDTAKYLGGVEDPNQDFPPGHYLPFPMAVAELQLADDIPLQLLIK